MPFLLVEAGRVELPSENRSTDLSTGLVYESDFPKREFHKQISLVGSFISRDIRKALYIHVHRLDDAL